MKTLTKGQFFGETNKTNHYDGITLTDTVYTHEKVDWHYHENAYFTLVLAGRVVEGNKKETYHCPAGTLLFHNWQEAHYNIKSKDFTRGFHIEIEQNWLKALHTPINIQQGSINLSDPKFKIGAYHIFKESKLGDSTSELATHSLLLNVLSQLSTTWEKTYHQTPGWVARLREIINDDPLESRTLVSLAEIAGIHPVHLSRDFAKHFHCNLGEYIRTTKVQKALSLLANKHLSLTQIAYDCGFADQSHFTRCFKAVNGLKPLQFRNILLQ